MFPNIFQYIILTKNVISQSNNILQLDTLISTVATNNNAELTQLNYNVKKYRERSWINLIPNLGDDFLNNRPIRVLQATKPHSAVLE